MAMSHDEDHDQLVARLVTGFGAMLEQVQQLASKNTELERRFARLQEQAQYLERFNRPAIALEAQDRPQEEQGGYTEPAYRPSGSEPGDEGMHMRTEDEEAARAIADGVEAWKVLTDGKGPLWRRHNANKLHEQQTRDVSEDSPKQNALPAGHPAMNQEIDGNSGCPFAALSHIGEHQTLKVDPSVVQRPDSLPTPPHTQEHFADGPHQGHNDGHYSPPPSVSGSISKCPIRMLDERSPEEIAHFFESHKHEIPRSHEICVRRYQSDSQTIRELDAKYGNLTNMIKGLGMKHQPLLPSKDEDDEDDPTMDTKSMRKVESWAQKVDAGHEGADISNDTETHLSGLDDDEQGQHFDIPLKEIRVGESPSRPWGISVPAVVPDLNLDESAVATPTPTPRGANPQTQTQSQTKAGEGPDFDPKGSRERRGKKRTDDEPAVDYYRPRMLFTGPVFIGYGPEQAAAFLKERAE